MAETSAQQLVDMDETATPEDAYTLLLHSLDHEHSAGNISRHTLIFQKWCRDYSDGLYIGDLENIIKVLTIFHTRYESSPKGFRKAGVDILKLCAKPLKEAKASERRKSKSMELLGHFYLQIIHFLKYDDVKLKTEAGKCLRCIVNAGNDPYVLRADQEKWKGNGLEMQLVDVPLIQKILRDSGGLETVVYEFLQTVQSYSVQKKDYDGTLESVIPKSPRRGGASAVKFEGEYDSDDDLTTLVETIKTSRMSSSEDALGCTRPLTSRENMRDIVSNTQTLAGVLLDLCIDLASDEESAAYLCALRVCDCAIILMKAGVNTEDSTERDPKMPFCVDLLFTVLEAYLAKSNFDALAPLVKAEHPLLNAEIMDFEECVSVLLTVMLNLLREGYCLADKEVRNEVAIIFSMVTNFPAASSHFVASGALINMITYVCVAEAGRDYWKFYAQPLANNRYFVSIFDVDIQFKSVVLLAISDVLAYNDPDALLLAASSPLLPVLLMYLEADSLEPASRLSLDSMYGDTNSSQFLAAASKSTIGSPSRLEMPTLERTHGTEKPHFIKQLSITQLRELQVIAVKFLALNANKVISEYVRLNGVMRIVSIIVHYCQSTLDEHRSIVFHSLLLLRNCLTSSRVTRKQLVEMHAIEPLLFLLKTAEEDQTRAMAARIISKLCSDNNAAAQGQLVEHHGLEIIIDTLHFYSIQRKALVGRKSGVYVPPSGNEDTNDLLGQDPNAGDVPTVLVATLDCLNRGLVGNEDSESYFADCEGVDKLLELLEVSPYTLRAPVLRLLSDLLENPLLVTFLMAWRSGKSMRSAPKLIAHAWVDEEVRLDGKRDKGGVLCNLSDPLGSHVWPTLEADLAKVQGPNGELQTSQFSTRAPLLSSSMSVSRLAEAINASKSMDHNSVPLNVRGKVLETDFRGVIAHIFHLIGIFEVDNMGSPLKSPDGELQLDEVNKMLLSLVSSTVETLSPAENQVLAIAKRYATLREGKEWKKLAKKLHEEGIVPIEADQALVDEQLKKAFDAAFTVQLEQMDLQSDETKTSQLGETAFHENLIAMRSQTLRAEMIKRSKSNRSARSIG